MYHTPTTFNPRYAAPPPPPPAVPQLWLSDRFGWSYRFGVLPIWAKPTLKNAVYAFTKGDGTILYIGKADDLPERLIGHEKMSAAILLGAEHLLVHLPTWFDPVGHEDAERRLIETLGPVLNDKHNPWYRAV